MNLAHMDLNLLVVFEQLMEDRHVTRAAEALGLSQPAVSNALRRLRAQLGDELFVRSAAGMQPTARATELATPVAQALGTLRGALGAPAAFDPARSVRCFTLAMTEVGQIYFLPPLMRRLAAEAPGVSVRAVAVTDTALDQAMAAGQVDLALGLLPQLRAGFYQQLLFRQRYVCLMRAAHPLAAMPTLTRAAFVAAGHVRVEARGTGHARIGEALARKGLAPRVHLSVPDYVALGHVLAGTDLIATVPERLADSVCAPLGLAARPLPVRLPTGAIHQLWHARMHRDPGSTWLRARVAGLFGGASGQAHAAMARGGAG
ncbi:MAG: LysR family transcriptional regulator [Pseudomonadota bacterium]|nr:LysR family transcriptional regulator [Pseudomonadota bacterium]